MAVYTKVTKEQVAQFLSSYDAGALVSFDGILQGVENTNYHVFTDKGRYILTIFEKRVKESELPFFFAFTKHLAAKGIHCPDAIPMKDGKAIGTIAGRPAALISFLEGSDIKSKDITPAHCREMGAGAARLHLAAQDFSGQRENTMYIRAWQELFEKTHGHADNVHAGLAEFIGDELHYHSNNLQFFDLPSGMIHADLFPDNVFFREGRLYGFLDFYFSSAGFYAYDLAIVANAWCFDTDNKFDPARFHELLAGYESVRPLSAAEKGAFQALCRAAALRIIMTRLHDWIFHDPQSLVSPKDPMEYVAKLKFHQSHDVIKG